MSYHILSFYELSTFACAFVILGFVPMIYNRYIQTHRCMKSKVVMMVDVLPIAIRTFNFSFKGCTDHDSISFYFYFFAFLFFFF